jgi:hypothetical protein
VKKVSVIKGNPISVLAQTPIAGNFSEYIVSIAFIGSTFMNAIEDNSMKDTIIKP